jgi:hypothetical protein
MSSSALPPIQPALTFRPLSPFLVLLISHANERLARPELAPASVTDPCRIDGADRIAAPSAGVPSLDRSV